MCWSYGRLLQKKGGLVYQYGKPFLETYQLCVDHLNQEKKN